jgi:ABC-2 type transport system ATP-binding protein
LAAALGIGAAVMFGCGVASADAATKAGASSPSSQTAVGSAQARHGAHPARGKTSEKKVDTTGIGQPTSIPTVAGAVTSSQRAVPTTTHSRLATELAAAPHDVSKTVAQALSDLAAPFTNGAPVAPDSPPLLTLLAAARKDRLASPVTSVAAITPTPGQVVAIPQIAPLAWLQQIPVIGPAVMTPIVALIHQIPILGDIIHPLVGYPLQQGLAPGTPVARDVKVISFDGTPIYVHFMPATGLPANQVAPTIFDAPGLPLPGSTSLDGTPLDGIFADSLGQISVATLRNAGYNVVTWDPRGEYNSGGALQIDSPDYEARDVSAIISWVATQPEVELDSPGDPRMGMVGISYGGGIQLVTAATDHRVDAIVPTIAWNALKTSLDKSQAFKTGWGSILGALLVLTGARPNPAILPAVIYGALTGMLTQAQQDLLAARGPGLPDDLIGDITAPTLFIQGTVDTLFTLQEAQDNAMALMANHVPTKVIWFCGGHGLCTNNMSDATDGQLITTETLAWLARYVKDDPDAVTGPQFEWVDQRGQYFSSTVYPAPPGNPIVVASTKSAVLPLVPFLGGSGGLFFVLPVGGTKAANALNLTIPAATTTTYIVGAPQLTLTYSGTGIGNHVYAQLVDNSTGLVIGNQVTPIAVQLDGQTHTVTVPLEQVAETLNPGQTVTLQLVASAADYQTIWSAGALNVSSMQLTLPTITGAVPVRTSQTAAVAGAA